MCGVGGGGRQLQRVKMQYKVQYTLPRRVAGKAAAPAGRGGGEANRVVLSTREEKKCSEHDSCNKQISGAVLSALE